LIIIDESVITELQLFLKATRRYLYDLQSFPTGHIRELFKFSKERYKLIKEVLAGNIVKTYTYIYNIYKTLTVLNFIHIN